MAKSKVDPRMSEGTGAVETSALTANETTTEPVTTDTGTIIAEAMENVVPMLEIGNHVRRKRIPGWHLSLTARGGARHDTREVYYQVAANTRIDYCRRLLVR